MGKQRKQPPCPYFENIRCKHSILGQGCKIDGCYDPTEVNRKITITEEELRKKKSNIL